MFSGFPTNTVVMIMVTMIAAGAGSWYALSQGLKRAPVVSSVRRALRWGAGALLISWLLVRLALAVKPPGGAVLANQFIITFTSLGLGLLAGTLPLLISPGFRQLVRAIPETVLIGLHAIRIGGFLFLALMDMKLLPPQFALSAGYGDITTGILALGLVYLIAEKKPYARPLVIAWNAFGLLDFVSALATGGIFIAPFAAQVAASGASLSYLNYVLIVPSFGVPLYALLHVYSLYQMFKRQVNEPVREAETSVRTPVFSE